MPPSASQFIEQTRTITSALAPMVPPEYLPLVQIILAVLPVAACIINLPDYASCSAGLRMVQTMNIR
jgi:hypothetical protein